MSLVWRSVTASALVAGSILITVGGCKSGGGWWSPGSSKWGSTESSTSDLAVSRPPTRVPTPSSTATPSSASDMATARSTPGAQSGPYGAGTAPAAGASGYGNQPAGWQGEPHKSVAPAGGYQTGGQYGMASAAPPPGVTPGAYSQPFPQGGAADTRTANAGGQTYPQADANAGGYAPADNTVGTATPAGDSAGSIYQDPSPGGAYEATNPSSVSGTPPPSDAPGAAVEPSSSVPGTPLYDPASTYENSEGSNPAATTATPTSEPITNPYSLSNTRPPTSPVPTSPVSTSTVPTTSPTGSTAPFDPPTLPSSLSATPGSYRPGSTAAPGTIYGTGYDTADGTMMR